jgi:hypothetical protein
MARIILSMFRARQIVLAWCEGAPQRGCCRVTSSGDFDRALDQPSPGLRSLLGPWYACGVNGEFIGSVRRARVPIALVGFSVGLMLLTSCHGMLSNPTGTGPSAGVVWTTNALHTAGEVASTAIPSPWGTLITGLLGLTNAGLIAWSAVQQKQIRVLTTTVAAANGGPVALTK